MKSSSCMNTSSPGLDGSDTACLDAILQDGFRRHCAKIAVIGLGYVGLPLACAIAGKGFQVHGYDTDPAKIQMLDAGNSYINNVTDENIQCLVQQQRLMVAADFSRLHEADAILICVPTPLNRHREPDLSYVENTAREIARHLRCGQLVVLESTTYPGTCAEVMKPILQAGGLRSGKDFFLAYSPEREDPGNHQFTTAAIPKVVSGDGPEASRLAALFYGEVFAQVVPVSSLEAAEAVKLTENIFRAVNIALVNELKIVYAAMGIDIWDVIDAAATKPFGYMPFYPGPGLGGHCIPIDPFYLTWKARGFGIATRFIELAGEINTDMPRYVLNQLVQAIDAVHERGLHASRILMLGLAYKKNVSDIRESPALRLMEMLEARGAKVEFFDPHVPVVPSLREYPKLHGRIGWEWNVEDLGGFHAALIVTDHDALDYAALAARCSLVVDTRNAMARHGVHGSQIVKA